MLGLLVGSFSSGCLLGWLVATHSTQPTSKTNTQVKQRYKKAYKGDLTDPQWQLLEPLIPQPRRVADTGA